MEVNSGAFNDRLRKVVKAGRKHIKQCMVSEWPAVSVALAIF